MKKRINISMFLLAFCSILLTSSFLIFAFYRSFSDQVKSELKTKASILEHNLNMEDDYSTYLNTLNLSNSELRITLVDATGSVVYDNMADTKNLENHSDREEIYEAQELGIGEGKRVSETVGKETWYYALKLNDQAVLRVATTTTSIYGLFVGVIPQCILIIFVMLILCLAASGSLTKKIINPINNFDFERNSTTYDELAPFLRTITSQKQQIQDALNEITRKSDMTEAISGNMKEGLLLTDKNGVVLSINKSALSILDIDEDASGKNILELTRTVPVLEHMKLALSGNDSNILLPVGEKEYQVFFSGVDNGALILFLDVTEKARAEKIRREFSGNVSHELKTPLTTISGFAELMSNSMVRPEDVPDIAKKIKSESDRLIILIEDIMRLSELDESDGERLYEWFDLTDVICEVSRNLTAKANDFELTFVLPDSPHFITANKQMIYEMLYNLVENAIKYNKRGGTITISASPEGGDTRITVSDTGIGVDKKHFARIFERFYRVDKSRSKKIGGTGLGLSIVKHIAAYHNGSVDIESEVESGTSLIVRLPNLPENDMSIYDD